MVKNIEVAGRVAQMLMQIKAIKLQPQNPFTWASGWKSPIYCDNRVSLSDPQIRGYIKEQLAELIKTHLPEVQVIAGVATAGVAQGALVADVLSLPYAYVRPEPKKHGMGNQIEGRLEQGQKVVLIEDLISTGGSSIKAAKAVQEAGGEVLAIVAIFDYGFDTAVNNFKEAGIPYYTLSSYEHMLPQAVTDGYINNDTVELLSNWRKDPAGWGVEA